MGRGNSPVVRYPARLRSCGAPRALGPAATGEPVVLGTPVLARHPPCPARAARRRLAAPGEGVGEIALLRAIPRTATVIAHTAATGYELSREHFLTAVLGHAATERQAGRIADARLAAGAAPGNRDTQG